MASASDFAEADKKLVFSAYCYITGITNYTTMNIMYMIIILSPGQNVQMPKGTQ